MVPDIVEVKVLEDYKLFIRFEDGANGEVNIAELVPFKGIFLKLKDYNYFTSVTIDSETGTISWDNGADISPCLLYSEITKK